MKGPNEGFAFIPSTAEVEVAAVEEKENVSPAALLAKLTGSGRLSFALYRHLCGLN